MSIYERIKTDSNRFLAGGDMKSVTLYNASNESKTANARVNTVAMKFTQQGQQHVTKVNSIGFNITEFLSITTTPVENETYKDWQGEFLNSQDETVKGVFNDIQIDYTLDYVSVNLTDIKT